jgi:diacylglycerol kinase (ATP)
MTHYSTIAIIYNPNSTGPSKSYAQELYKSLRRELSDQKTSLIATKHAGHAEEIAYSLAIEHTNPLIISSSGDGGYHEVVNGALRAQSEGAKPTTALLPAGNANDHHRNLHSSSLIKRITKGESEAIDVLTLEGHSKGKRIERYAHSYIGFGLTPRVGKELNKTSLTRFKEKVLVVRSFFQLRPVALWSNDSLRQYDSLIISNIDSMAKYLRISTPSSVTDGKFEVTAFMHTNKFFLLLTLIKAVITGSRENSQASHYAVKTVTKTILQADGEIYTFDADSDIFISIKQKVLHSIV